MTLFRMVVPAIVVFLGTTGLYTARASGQYQGTPPSSYGRNSGAWDAPPRGMQEIQRQGFRDGILGAQKDFGNHRQWNVNNRDEYRNPNVPRNQRAAYQNGFRLGYERGVARLTGGSYSGSLYTTQVQESEIQRRGFQDGMDGAQKDLGNHRQWNVNNRDEYRNPNVPAGSQQEYRDAFYRGYQQFVSQHSGGQPYRQ